MSDAAAIADASYFDWWRVWASAIEGGAVRDIDGVLCAATGGPMEWWNVAFVTRPLGRPEEALRRAAAFFDERGQRFIVRVREGIDPASERAAASLGMPYTDSVPGMVLAPLAAGAAAAPAGLDIRRVTDARTLEDCARIDALAFEYPLEEVQRLLPMRLIDHERWRSYVGYVDGRPATTAALLVTGDIAGVYFVGTPEEFRRRGLGEAITRHVVQEGAALGCRVATLQATEMGRPVYERMGFRVVAQYRTFVRPEFRERP